MPLPQIILNPLWPKAYATREEAVEQYPEAAASKEGLKTAIAVMEQPEMPVTYTEYPFRPSVYPAQVLFTGLWLLAGPVHSSISDKVAIANVKEITKLAAALMTRGVQVLSPLTHAIPIWSASRKEGSGIPPLNLKDDIWYTIDLQIAKECVGVLLAPGWADSHGCHRIYGWFEASSRPIVEIALGK